MCQPYSLPSNGAADHRKVAAGILLGLQRASTWVSASLLALIKFLNNNQLSLSKTTPICARFLSTTPLTFITLITSHKIVKPFISHPPDVTAKEKKKKTNYGYVSNTFIKLLSIIWPTLRKSISEGILDRLCNLCFSNHTLSIVFQKIFSHSSKTGADFQTTWTYWELPWFLKREKKKRACKKKYLFALSKDFLIPRFKLFPFRVHLCIQQVLDQSSSFTASFQGPSTNALSSHQQQGRDFTALAHTVYPLPRELPALLRAECTSTLKGPWPASPGPSTPCSWPSSPQPCSISPCPGFLREVPFPSHCLHFHDPSP